MAKTYSVPNIYRTLQQHQDAAALQTPLKVSVPGSKSITNRALLLATLADGRSTLKGVLFSDDSRHFLNCIQELGFQTTVDEGAKVITVEGCGGTVPKPEAKQFVGSAGTAARFLTAYLGISEGIYHMDASDQMRKRPMAPLLDSLKELGCEVIYEPSEDNLGEGHFPFTLKSHGFQKDCISVNIDSSSQFLSALLIASCLSEKDFTAYIEGTHGRSYIDMTVKMMEQFGVKAVPLYYCSGEMNHGNARDNGINTDIPDNGDAGGISRCAHCANSTLPMGYRTAAGQTYRPLEYQVEPDVSAACYFYAIAPYADSPTVITGIGHIRFQESDRITAIVTELRKMGIRCEETECSITIYPGHPQKALVETYDDHRMAMGFSLTGLRSDGIVIANPDCCKKTFEEYFDVLKKVTDKLSYTEIH